MSAYANLAQVDLELWPGDLARRTAKLGAWPNQASRTTAQPTSANLAPDQTQHQQPIVEPAPICFRDPYANYPPDIATTSNQRLLRSELPPRSRQLERHVRS